MREKARLLLFTSGLDHLAWASTGVTPGARTHKCAQIAIRLSS